MNFWRSVWVQLSCLRWAIATVILLLCSCNSRPSLQQKEVVATPQEINVKAEDIIRSTIEDLLQNPASLPDSIKLKNADLLQALYSKSGYTLLWSSEGKFQSSADSLFQLVDSCRQFGLLPSDYYADRLNDLRTTLKSDTSKATRLDATKWTYLDLLSTSAFVQLVKDLKVGRLLADSILVRDTTLHADFFTRQRQVFDTASLAGFTAALEPANKDYYALKEALKTFLPTANFRRYTSVKGKDSILLRAALYQRLTEEDSLKISPLKHPDSLALAAAIKKYQRRKKMKEDGRLSTALISKLNNSDREKFLRVALTLDKYKMLPKLPDEYLWVNLPAFAMEVRRGDTVTLSSKIICGKSATRTPQLTSAITNMVTYPQWTIPESIIKKEILPGLQRDAGYTQRRGYSIVDDNGNEVNPFAVKWAKYKSGIPYKVVQGSGDDNALGVMKFNFANPYDVYLHDTNQRYLFEKGSRALSHGCVRVQKWRDLAVYLIRKDSTADSTRYTPVDSLDSWLTRKAKRVIRVNQRLPLFIRYFSTEGRNGKLIFHEDIYEEDRRLREKVFASR